MTGLWRRKGLLLPSGGGEWWVHHAQAPCVLALSSSCWRIYFSGRNAHNRASILAVDVDPSDDFRIIDRHLAPLLDSGSLGSFDSDGLGASCVLKIAGRIHLYYTGVAVRRDVGMQLAIGLCISDDGLSFTRAFEGPIRSTGPFDPYLTSTPHVRPHGGGFRMWYVSGTGWVDVQGRLEPVYDIKTCASKDGLIWETSAQVTVPTRLDREVALGRPYVTSEPEGLRLWYSRRGHDFRSEGPDAYQLVSSRLDDAGIAIGEAEPVLLFPSPQAGDFDSWMQAYGCVMPYEDTQVLFYNGNDFGEAGLGWAIREIDP